MSDVQVTHMKTDNTLEESGEARRHQQSLSEMADEAKSRSLLREIGLPDDTLLIVPEKLTENRWAFAEVKRLSDSLVLALDACEPGHALLALVARNDGVWSEDHVSAPW